MKRQSNFIAFFIVAVVGFFVLYMNFGFGENTTTVVPGNTTTIAPNNRIINDPCSYWEDVTKCENSTKTQQKKYRYIDECKDRMYPTVIETQNVSC